MPGNKLKPKVGEIWEVKGYYGANAFVLFLYEYKKVDMCEVAILDSEKICDIGDTLRVFRKSGFIRRIEEAAK